ncbi:CGNR zinc finger domain-containing protein [Streptomyces canus]|uniref:RNA-binding Zn ribbon-like protein n=1 Tax=Streptomyces canus TaxID=58343 RepID=A0AAW8FM66_9ACTN|nr:ABATE domain-containing protein [Streptomyces canus]MDQ0761204.1 putative RNA-binding Zn ribbon-like protein [Streptomyces canus]MDQ0910162.1 putative RNA-binding Zn ribbon-like protein [Streptomyces canus]MDQ1070172.1 putative RNA-binding Zn ribbon-like protein [Streptomyces canus]
MALGMATVAYELRFDAGRISLDLLATTHPEERLDSTEVLCAWIVGSGLVPDGTDLTHADPSWLVGFRELRGWIGQLVRGAPGGQPGRVNYAGNSHGYDLALAHVNDVARAAPPAPRAVRDEDGSLVRELDGPPGCAALLGAIARDAVGLLTDPVARAAIRECEGDNCPIVYLDTSRGRRRRWCSSEVCGNRERVARHRRRAALSRT